jgi:cation diffusion facilitator CzcD-associated flavoprotein CzcO
VTRVAIVGAGFSGIGVGIALRREGIEDFRIFERGDELGGVWHHNTYPGIACDVPSYLYQYSFDQRRDWAQPCPPGAEIATYLRDVADRHDIRRHITFGTEVESATWNDARWTLRSGDSSYEADVLVLACGQLHRPRWPSIEGMESFAGHTFHSAEWDHDHDLVGKRVACIGTGASAIQFVPEIAKSVRQLDVYQRTPPWMLPRKNPLYARWQRLWFERIPGAHALRRFYLYAWIEWVIAGLTRFAPIRWYLQFWSSSFMRGQVKDKKLRRKITPDYPLGCKRVLFSSYWLMALQQPNVELVDSPIDRITPDGVVSEGRERKVDTIIYGTGFKANDFVAPMKVTGRDGADLNATWREGAEAHLGITVSGFPNLFLMYGPNTNLAVGTIIYMIESQIDYVIDALRVLRARGASALDVRADVQARSNARVQRAFDDSIWTNCNSWYRAGGNGRITNNWPDYMAAYRKKTRAVDVEEYELISSPTA